MEITKRTHYNPCFWTAFWNPDYYQSAMQGLNSDLKPRDQMVYSLNVKANKIYKTKVNSVHYEKNLGIAEITYEQALEFCKRNDPKDFNNFLKTSDRSQYPLFLDYENILTGLELTPAYQVLPDVIKRQNILNKMEKGFLADFIFMQLLRGHAIMSSLLEVNELNGIPKFEYFVKLKWILSSAEVTYPIVARIGLSQWIFYITEKDTFPLCDSPVLVKPNNIMIALSPRLLLVVLLDKASDSWLVKEGIRPELFHDFKKRTLRNTFREIIFSDKHLLEKWQISRIFHQRVEKINKIKNYRELIKERIDDLWLLNAAITEKEWLAAVHSNPLFFRE
jgi:hypothetical protein